MTPVDSHPAQGWPMLVWGALVVVVVVAGFALWLVGLLVAVPVIGHATWHACRALVAPAGSEAPG